MVTSSFPDTGMMLPPILHPIDRTKIENMQKTIVIDIVRLLHRAELILWRFAQLLEFLNFLVAARDSMISSPHD
jgi:hypothetical protein